MKWRRRRKRIVLSKREVELVHPWIRDAYVHGRAFSPEESALKIKLSWFTDEEEAA